MEDLGIRCVRELNSVLRWQNWSYLCYWQHRVSFALKHFCTYDITAFLHLLKCLLLSSEWRGGIEDTELNQSARALGFQSFIECPSLSKCSGLTKVNNDSSCFLSKNGERQEREKQLYAVHTVVTHQGSGIRKQEFKLKLRCFSRLILGKPRNDPELISPVKWYLPLMILTSWCCCGYKIVFMEVYYCKWVTVQQCLQSCGAVFL